MTPENMARNLRNAFHAHEMLAAWEYIAESDRVRWRRALERARQMFLKEVAEGAVSAALKTVKVVVSVP